MVDNGEEREKERKLLVDKLMQHVVCLIRLGVKYVCCLFEWLLMYCCFVQ